MFNQRGNSLPMFVLAILIILVVGAVYFYGTNNKTQQVISEKQNDLTLLPATSSMPQSTSFPSGTPADITSWKTFVSKNYSFKYPAHWLKGSEEEGVDVMFAAPATGECAIPGNGCGGSYEGVTVVTLANTAQLSVQDFIKEDKYNRFNLSHFVKDNSSLGLSSDWVIDRTAPGAGSQQELLIFHKNTVVDFSCRQCSDQLTNQIISTFNFTN